MKTKHLPKSPECRHNGRMQSDPKEIYTLAKTAKGYRARQNILRATAKVVAHKGLESATVLAICEQADIGRTTLYNYFKDAEDAVASVLDESAAELQAQFELIHGEQERGIKRLAYCLRFILEQANADPDWGRLIVELYRLGSQVDAYLRTQVELEISAASKHGEVDLTKTETDALVRVISASVVRLCDRLSKGEADTGEIAPTIIALLRGAGVDKKNAKNASNQKLSQKAIFRSSMFSDG